jgi:hypothetical protein
VKIWDEVGGQDPDSAEDGEEVLPAGSLAG